MGEAGGVVGGVAAGAVEVEADVGVAAVVAGEVHRPGRVRGELVDRPLVVVFVQDLAGRKLRGRAHAIAWAQGTREGPRDGRIEVRHADFCNSYRANADALSYYGVIS